VAEARFLVSLLQIFFMKILLEGDSRTSPEQFDPKVLKVFVKIAEKFKDMY